MDEVLHANIFFFITSVATIVVSMLLVVGLYQVIRILQSIRRIFERIDASSEMIAEDVEQLRSYVLEGSLVSQLIGFFVGRGAAKRTRRRSRTKSGDED